MRFFMFTTVAASVAVAIAVPALDNRQARVCNSRLYSQPVCCSTNIVGVAAVDCAPPRAQPTDISDFKRICGASGKQADCCARPVVGQSVLCIAI